ncbi:MAG: hypothetical protein QOE05_305 [Actinomycetota bacterium]|nr:hypothetical protein [Actinomycetota bacterium]
MVDLDVAVIGAGVHGASAALHLAERGARVRVYDRLGVAAGPTGRSSAICRAYYTNEFLARVAQDSIEFLADFPARTGGYDAGFRQNGIVYLHPESDRAAAAAVADRLRSQGTECELVDPDRVGELAPGLDPDGVGFGVYLAGAGYADPAGTTHGLLARALTLGADVRIGADVAAIAERAGGGAVLTMADGDVIECSRLLVAAGPWTAPLCRQFGVELPLTVERHIVTMYEVPPELRLPVSFSDLIHGYYYRPEGDSLFCLGLSDPAPQVDPDDFAADVTDDEVLELGGRVAKRVPKFENAAARGGWASVYDVSPDWQPVIGQVADGIFVDAGTSGHGFKLAPVLGRHVADMVCGGPTDPGLEQFSPARFDRGGMLQAGFGRSRVLG